MKHLTLEEERHLVERAQSGSRAALNRLIEAHYQQMYHLALKITRDTVLAEDITQEACVQVLRRIDQFRAEARFNSWLSRIVLNTALLKHRREKRLVPTEDIYSPNAVSLEPLPDQVIMHRELLEKTDSFLGALRDGDRDLFVMRFVEGQSLQTISDETGLSLPALKSRFHRARQRLKDVAESCKWEFEAPPTAS
jgi:RNA polymerase sigma-70 factor (ECF subfamily)